MGNRLGQQSMLDRKESMAQAANELIWRCCGKTKTANKGDIGLG
jgi:hypothetical protein